MLDVFDIEGYKKVDRLNKYPMTMPRDKIMMFLNLKTKSNLPSQESGISFLFSSTANPDFEAYRAYQKKTSISKVNTLTMINKESNILKEINLVGSGCFLFGQIL
ncbi:hypothetical protein N9Q60_01535 [Flavobacteriaceae bacterium]|nr:hypothetical protein [Flavobacteriaceae bacterium]